jgi:AcrR family transcriptional regulator
MATQASPWEFEIQAASRRAPAPPAKRSRRGIATQTAILDAAERLIAERGLAGVSLGEIARAANQRNRAATQYYFSSLDELVMAIMARSSPDVRQRRTDMLRELDLAGRGHDIRSLVEVQVLPTASLLGHSGAQFRFIAQLISPNLPNRFHWSDEPDLETLKDWESRVHAGLAPLRPQLRTQRIYMALDVFASTMAALEAQLERGVRTDVPLATTALIDAMTAILCGPDSTASRTAQ